MAQNIKDHFAALNAAFGRCTSDDLRTLGQAKVADDLQASVSACTRQHYEACLGPAQAIVEAAWTVLQQTGWDHPAWQEAYSLGQLCLAAAYSSLDKSTPRPAAAAATPHLSPQITDATDYRQRGVEGPGATAAAAPLDCPAMKAMQALDLASIMGAPAEFLAPVLGITEPFARQEYQARLSHHLDHSKHMIEAAMHKSLLASANQHQPNENGVDNGCMRQSTESHPCNGRHGGPEMGDIPSILPTKLPRLDPDRTIASRSAKGLTAAEFKKLYWKTDTPVVITGAMESWKAMHKWGSLPWWNHNHGHRTIPVELGTDSTNTWRETTMLLHTFMTDYLQPSVNQQTDAEVAYIAQHPLFDQLPNLTSDFEQPGLMGGESMQMNAWIGTEGTVTPLHFDSYDNFLAQVAGFKFLRLYSRKDTPCLYVECGQGTKPALNATRAQKNISAVNVEDPDLAQHPKFAEAKQLECILGPGDMLFIPAKYWHYVRSLSPAVSINFWY